MKIALYNVTTTIKAGGVETFYKEMARTLSVRGHTVDLYTGKGGDLSDIASGVRVCAYPFIDRGRFPDFGTRFRKFTERLSFAGHAFGDLTRGGYDYIYTRKPYDLPAALLSARFSRAGVIYGSGGTEFFPGYKQLVKRVSLFFACSRYNADQIEAYCGLRPQVLYNGVNGERFRPLGKDPELLLHYNPGGTRKVIMTVCRLIGWKGVDLALKAIAELNREGISPLYLIIGDGPERGRLERLAAELGIAGQVVFLGRKPNQDLPRYYSLADLAVFRSVGAETFGITLAEAMACGVPVVSTTVGGIPEVVAGEGGLLVEPKDVASLANGIKTLLLNDELRREFSARGRRRVLDNFTWEKTTDNLEAHIQAVKVGS